jgi:FAD dependent oxidoreductase TIGR03364
MMKTTDYDIIITGAGVLGSFHAYHACKKGLRVLLLEKDMQPGEATVRNFGQVVPSGMSQGKWQEFGRRSLDIYKQIQKQFDISVRNSGSIYIASDETELTLLHELAGINKSNDYTSFLLGRNDCLQKLTGLKKEYCKGGLVFPDEITVEPDKMIHRLIAYMQEQLQLTYRNHTLVSFCDYVNGKCMVEDSMGNSYTSDLVFICNGRDFQYLFPSIFYDGDIEVSKLQMMKTVPNTSFRLPGSVLTGLSIRRYESFQDCPSYKKLPINKINPSCKKWGIHILFKQAIDGGIIIGDSHEYAPAKDQRSLGYEINQQINEAILEEARRVFDFPNWQIASAWNGFYAQSKKKGLFQEEVKPHIHVVTAIGGKGMTASAGLAESVIEAIF